MIETELSPIHSLPSGLCEDSSGEAAALLTRMAKADATALLELHGMWGRVFMGISLEILTDRKEAEKAVQAAFVDLWRHSSEYDPHQMPPFVWAFTRLRACCLKRLRSCRPARPRIRPSPSTAGENPENPQVMPLDDFRRVRSALDQLTPDESGSLIAAVFLQFARSRRIKPLAAPSASLKNLLRQALKKIRNPLSRYEL